MRSLARAMNTKRVSRAMCLGMLVVLGVAVCAGLVRTFSRPSIRVDGVGYYAPLASVLFDNDLDLRNEIAHAERWMRKDVFSGPDGVVDPFPVGAAILWAPALIVAKAIDRATHGDTAGGWRFASRGFEPRYVSALALASGLEALLGGVLLYWLARFRTSVLPAMAGTVGAMLGTPVVYYALADPSYAHSASFLACSALLAATLSEKHRRVPIWALGTLWALVALVRWQDGVLGVILAPRLLREARAARAAGIGACLRALTLFVLPACLVLLPQVLFWKRIYGHFFVATLGMQLMDWGRPRILPFLISTWQGAFVWSPLFLVGFAGLRCVPERGLRFALWTALALEVYTCSAARDWWAGGSFGARRLVAVAPFAGLGLALWAQAAFEAQGPVARKRKALVLGLVTLGTAWNLRLAQYNVTGLIPNNPANPRAYERHYPAGDPHRQLYPLWDYARLGHELWDAEKQLWSAR